MKKFIPLVSSLILVLCSACYQSNETYTLNPDGSGKVQFDILLVNPSLGMDNENLPLDQKLQQSVSSFLSQSKGVEAWKDVSFRWNEDGRTHIQGVAYFRELETLSLGNQTIGLSPVFSKEANGTGILKIQWKKNEDKLSKSQQKRTLTEEEIQKELFEAKVDYMQKKIPFSLAFASMVKDATFYMPGKIQSATNFIPLNDNQVSFHWNGEKFFKQVDAIYNNETLLRNLIRQGINPSDINPSEHSEIMTPLFAQ